MIDPSIELRHLRYFLEAADTQNVSRAAERLGVSQPSISQQIKDLERALGVQLFHRLGKRIRLTPAGEDFRVHAQLVLRKLEHSVESLSQLEQQVRGHLHVGVVPAFNVPLMPTFLGTFHARYPRAGITVHELPVSEIETGLESGKIDVGLGLLLHTASTIEYETLSVDRFALLVPPHHALASQKTVKVADLEGHLLVLLPERYPMRRVQNEMFEHARVRPRIAEVDSSEVILRAITTMGAATLMPHMIFRDRPELGLRAIEFEGRIPSLDFGLVWLVGADKSSIARAFADIVRERFVVSGKR
ncbi:MAG: LysR family transcriptional regulator [Planctomycetota bacterium]|nr:MAG: LysR family transcriptional regulator [Planctomycetota bacterium]